MGTSIASKIRLGAAAAPIVVLIAALILLGGIYTFGQSIGRLREGSLTALRAAQGMTLALYQVETSATRPDGAQIMADQSREFDHWLALAGDRAESDEQRRDVAAIARQAESVFADLRGAGLSAMRDETIARRLGELHGRISDLIGADDSVVIEAGSRARQQATRLGLVVLAAMVLVPWLGFAWLARMTGRLRDGLRTLRDQVDKLAWRADQAGIAPDARLKALDEALAALGHPKPNPMLDQ